MKAHAVIVWAGTVCTVVLGAIAAIVTWQRGAAFGVTMAFSVMATVFNLLAVPFFLWGVRRFSAGLQRAYWVLCIGIGAFGVAQIQLPLVNLFNWGWWINSGGVAAPYLVGVIGIFWGMRRFAALLGTTGVWTSVPWALLATVVMSGIGAVLPHVGTGQNEAAFDVALALSICNSVFITFAAVAAFGIRTKIGATYKHSMSWLCAALAVVSFAGWHYTIVQMTMTTGDWYYDYSANIVPFVVGAVLLMAAGYAFDMLSSAALPAVKTDGGDRVELEAVLYAASLVSRPTDVDVILDAVRDLTSHLAPGQALSTADRENLLQVYGKLEAYLAHSDPLRTIAPPELRHMLQERFGWSPAPSQSA